MTIVVGRITRTDTTPAPGVWVYAYPADGARFGQVTGVHTDIAGRWRLDLAPGRWTIRETGHHTHDVTVGDTPISLSAEPVEVTTAAPPAVRRGAAAPTSGKRPARTPRDGGRIGDPSRTKGPRP